jgi:hypothetical protein
MHALGVIQNLIGKLRALDLAPDLLCQCVLELRRREGRALFGQSLQYAAGVALLDRIAQFVGGFPPRRDNAAMLALIVERPCRQFALAAFEVVAVAGRRVDVRGDDMNVRVILIIVGDKEGLGVAHAERLQCVARRFFHLLAGRLFADAPR